MNKFFKAFVLVLGLCLLICGVAMADDNPLGARPDQWVELRELAVESTCYSNGYKIYANRYNSDERKKVDQPLADHSPVWKEVEYPDCTKQGKAEWRCKWCDKPMHYDATKGKNVIAATPDTKILEKGSHNTVNNPKNFVIPATCQTKGEYHDFCLTCGKELITEFEDKNAHVFGADQPLQKETCTEDGLYERICVLCGYAQIVPQFDEKGERTHPALGHVISDEEATENFWNYPELIQVSYHQDATCQYEGWTKYELVCSRCNKSRAEKWIKIEKLPHDLEKDTIVIDEQPSCDRAGLAHGFCTVCEQEVEQVLAKLPHKLEKVYIGHSKKCDVEEKHSQDKPTCVLGADYYNKCKTCGNMIDKDGNDTKDLRKAAIYHQAALGHDWSDWETRIEASKDSLGLRIRVCNRCMWINKQSFTTEPTCTEDETIYDYLYKENGTSLVSYEVIVNKAPGHKEVEDPAVEPTYDAPGKTSGSHCEVCGAIIKEQQVIPPLADPAAYTLSDVKFDGSAITGKVVHVEHTAKVDALFVRIAVFMADGTYMITVAPVADDLTFEIGASGDFVYAGLVVTGTMKSIAPGSYVTYGSVGIEL